MSAGERQQLGPLIRKGKGPARRLLKGRSDSQIIPALDTFHALRVRQATG